MFELTGIEASQSHFQNIEHHVTRAKTLTRLFMGFNGVTLGFMRAHCEGLNAVTIAPHVEKIRMNNLVEHLELPICFARVKFEYVG